MSTKLPDGGFFTTFEGIDFTGKTPIVEWLKQDLLDRGFDVVVTRDPPYALSPWTELYEQFERGEKLSKPADALLFLTSRQDNWEKLIKPSLEEGSVVLSDRFVDSWFAYQSIRLADRLGDEDAALRFLLDVHEKFVEHGLIGLPDLTILLSEDPNLTMARAVAEGGKLSKFEVLDIQERIADQYHKIAALFPDRVKVVEGRGRPVPQVYEDAREIALEALNSMMKEE